MDDRYLCKAKRLDNGKWVEGYLVEQDAPEYHAYIIRSIKIEMDERHIDILEQDIYEIDPETICRFTGLLDKNGQKSWENDVICIESYSYLEPEDVIYGIIRYSKHYTAFCLELEEKWIPIYECTGSYTTIYRVMGNKFDNPELLEVAE